MYKPPSDDEFFRAFGVHLDEVDEPRVIKSTATEKPTEKEETIDGWASIRGMNNSTQIIAELESVGIHSVGEFTYFNLQVSRDISDVSEKLAALKKRIGSIDTLISKIKQHTKLSATYKEYQGLSSLKQKH